MPIVDRREFGGRFTVKENSQRLANYRYLEVQLIEMIAGWCHTTPQIAFKAAFGYHVYDHAQAADLLGERLEQLRSGRERQEPATDAFAELCEHVWKLEVQADIEARLVECGGVTGQGIESHWLAFHSAKGEQKPPRRTKRGKTGYR